MINKSFTIVSIDAALQRVNSCFGSNVRTPSELMKLLEKQNGHWIHLDNWENLSDEEIFENIEKVCTSLANVYVINEVSYRDGMGAFSLTHNQIKSFVANHLSIFGECFFNGDILVVSMDEDSILAFHHEGIYASFKGSNAK